MRFATKRLTRSDLTLFDFQFRRQNAGNQKAINLNRNVFVDVIFPAARERAGGLAAQFPVTLRIFGPNAISDPQTVTRKVIAAGGSQKNWRLNGETIKDPDEGGNTDRYHSLRDGDVALFGFEGAEVPDAIDLVLLSQMSDADDPVYKEIDRIMGQAKMLALTDADLELISAVTPVGHPVLELIDPYVDEALEEAALGSYEAVERLIKKRRIRRMGGRELADALERAVATGRNGEVLIVGYLRRLQRDGIIEGFVWEADTNAICPWDMTIHFQHDIQRAEVKSTKGLHEHKFHISQSELRAAADVNAPPTQIWRVSELTDESGLLRRSKNFRDFARSLCLASDAFGIGAVPDSWTVDPGRLEWDEPTDINFDDEPDD